MNETLSWLDPLRPEVRLTDRAIRFVKEPCEAALQASVVVGISHRNQPEHLHRALQSVAMQDMPAGSVVCLVLDDSSDAGWMSGLDSNGEQFPLMVIAAGRMGSPAQARNALLDLVDAHFPNARWVARLDADDELAAPDSLRALVEAGESGASLYVVGSNRLRLNGAMLPLVNRACDLKLRNRHSLLHFIEAFCRQLTETELPSCNLLLRTRSRIRYPNARSAEDHWLVAALLMHWPDKGAVVATNEYAVYALNGSATEGNRRSLAWVQSRHALAAAARVWHDVHASGEQLLGWGQEGVVCRTSGSVVKRFYPYAIREEELHDIGRRVRRTSGAIISFEVIDQHAGCSCIRLDDVKLSPILGSIPDDVMQRFLIRLYRAGVVASNIKRDNLMHLSDGELVYVDIGRDIVELTVSRFLDCAARLYAVGRLGWSDHELARRKTRQTQVQALSGLHGFDAFYRSLIETVTRIGQFKSQHRTETRHRFEHPDVTLLLKACPQDWQSVERQTTHIVGELRDVLHFGKVVLLIDPHDGPYLRQYSSGNGVAVRDAARRLVQEGWLDEVWVADPHQDVVTKTHTQWFGHPHSLHTQTHAGAPLFAQLWGLDQVETRYVLQLDIDVLVCLKDPAHDAVADMKRAMEDPTVWCVGFNIPKAHDGFVAYHGEPRQFAPEVRFGLLDLQRVRSCQPFHNPVVKGKYLLTWHRALQAAQSRLGKRSVRGGDSRTCYLHPLNADKCSAGLAVARDLFSQGVIPAEQHERWDMVAGAHWAYPRRHEDIVVLALGRETSPEKLNRFVESLKQQERQDFGVILIDDGGMSGALHGFLRRNAWLNGRLTMNRRSSGVGYLENFRESVREICARPETLVVVVDQDDALLGADVIDRLWLLWSNGADLINAPMFRPDKPTQLYTVDHVAPRQKGGGNVWAHLRAFRKSLYEQIPGDCWHDAPDPMCLSDFLTMVPMAERARQPVFMDGPYVYLHERLPYGEDRKLREAKVKAWLFSQPSLHAGASKGRPDAELISGAWPTG